MYLLSQSKTNLSALELMRHLGVCYRTAWRLKHKLMQAMTEREADRRLGGLVQMDDAYPGGERNGGKAGRGSENKRPFVSGVSTNEAGHPRYAVIAPVVGFTTAALTDWAKRHLQPETDVYSDGLGAFRAVVDLGHAHTVIHSAGPRAATEATNARWVNIVLSNLNRSLDGTCHWFGFFKYAHGTWPKRHGDSIDAFSSMPWCRGYWSRQHEGNPGPNAACATCPSMPADTRR